MSIFDGIFGIKKTAGPSVDSLNGQIRTLKDEVADLKHEKKITEEDIKHMVRIKEEKMAVEAERKEVQRDCKQQEAIATVKDEYRDKMESRLQSEVDNIKDMYGQILQRLPKVSVRQYDTVNEEVKTASDD